MSTIVMKGGAVGLPPTAARRSSRAPRRRIAYVSLILAIGLLMLATAAIVDRRSTTSESAAATVPTALGWEATAAPWLARLEVVRLEKQLVQAGYSIEVDGRLDPLTRSALADLGTARAEELSPSLARALEGTAMTGLRDPIAWNNRFGLDRATRLVERPLTGPGGQLDANGNVR